MTSKESSESASSDSAAQSSEPSASLEDDTKRRFREALDRKKANSASGSAHTDGGAKQPRTHGPVESRREFRRKSV